MPKSIEDRFWEKVKQLDTDQCWEWQAAQSKKTGYGYFYSIPNEQLAHRASWILHFGSIPNELCVLHHCDNPSCVNPNHLFLGDQSDNMRDASNKHHRYARSKKERKQQIRIQTHISTHKRNAMIRFLYSSGCYTMLEIAELAHISESYVSLIVANKR